MKNMPFPFSLQTQNQKKGGKNMEEKKAMIDRDMLQKVFPVSVAPELFQALPVDEFLPAVLLRLLLKNADVKSGCFERMICDSMELAGILCTTYDDVEECMDYLDEEMVIKVETLDGVEEIRPIESYDLCTEVLEVKLNDQLVKYMR